MYDGHTLVDTARVASTGQGLHLYQTSAGAVLAAGIATEATNPGPAELVPLQT